MSELPFRERIACMIAEACAATSLGKTKLREEIAAGRIGASKAGARTLVSVASLLAYLDPGADAPAAESAPPSPCICFWCGRRFKARATGGSPQRFCSQAHRHEFGSMARRWAVKAIEAGLITVATLKGDAASVRAVPIEG